jgi:RNA polymerase sigma-70 factor (ECF subfamily)
LSTALAPALPADATRRLYERHSSRIFGFCLSRLGSREEAEDALQTTFLNAQRGLGSGIVPEYELAWLFKIAQNVCHNRHESARRRGRVEATHDLDALQDVIASPDRSSAVSLAELTRALGAVPARQRQALLLREFQGYSYEEIASELDISVAAVETLLFRARRTVAQQLEQSGARPLTQRGAAASIFELFRWLFGGAAAPLKLAAVAAAVATTATLSVGAVDKPAAHAPVILERPAVVPVTAAGAPRVSRATGHPAIARTSRPGLSPRPALAAPTTPALPPVVEIPSSAPDFQPAVSSPRVEATTTPAPPVSTPDVAVTHVTLPGVTVPAVMPAVTLPAVPLPVVTVPSVTVPPLTVPAVVLPDLQLPATPGLPKLP